MNEKDYSRLMKLAKSDNKEDGFKAEKELEKLDYTHKQYMEIKKTAISSWLRNDIREKSNQ